MFTIQTPLLLGNRVVQAEGEASRGSPSLRLEGLKEDLGGQNISGTL